MAISKRMALQEQAATLEGVNHQMDWQEKYFQKIEEGIADLKGTGLLLHAIPGAVPPVQAFLAPSGLQNVLT